MNQKFMTTGEKSLKIAVASVLFGAMLFFGLFSNQATVSGEEAVFEGYDSRLDQNECIDQDVYGNCEEVEVPYDLVEEEKIYPAVETRPQITWQKNAVSLGNFNPDGIYVLEDAGKTFKIIETQTIADDDGIVNLIAFGMDENDNDYYSFHMRYASGGSDWRASFVDFVTNFEN